MLSKVCDTGAAQSMMNGTAPLDAVTASVGYGVGGVVVVTSVVDPRWLRGVAIVEPSSRPCWRRNARQCSFFFFSLNRARAAELALGNGVGMAFSSPGALGSQTSNPSASFDGHFLTPWPIFRQNKHGSSPSGILAVQSASSWPQAQQMRHQIGLNVAGAPRRGVISVASRSPRPREIGSA